MMVECIGCRSILVLKPHEKREAPKRCPQCQAQDINPVGGIEAWFRRPRPSPMSPKIIIKGG